MSDNKHLSSVYWIHNKLSQSKLQAILETSNHIKHRKSRKTLKEKNKANNLKAKHRPSEFCSDLLCPWPASLELLPLLQVVMQVSAEQTILMVVKYFMHPFVAVTEENRTVPLPQDQESLFLLF